MSGSPPGVSDQPDNQSLATLAIIVSAVLYSLVPVLIHWTAQNSNPFYFNSLIRLALTTTVASVLIATKRRWVGDWRMPPTGGTTTGSYKLFKLVIAKVFTPSARLPLLFAIVGSLDYAFFAWSIHYVDTAIASTVYELWPVVLIYILIRYRNRLRSEPNLVTAKVLSTEQILLSSLAVVGLYFILASQSDGEVLSILNSISLRDIIGITLALLAAILSALGVHGNFVYGEKSFEGYTGESSSGNLKIGDLKKLMWFTLVGHAIAKGVASIISFGMGIFLVDSSPGEYVITGSAISGFVLVGIVGGIALTLLSLGNVIANKPSVNLLYLISPVLALFWLSQVGIIIPRTDLFVIGAALILTVNALLQAKPDQERGLSRFGKESMPGTRLGFTAFIMSIWSFGAVIYLRDEIMPSSRLVYSIDEYWGLIALSATVFALILGFRIARLSNRINKEDETIINLFRDSQCLERRGIFSSGIVESIAILDTAKPKKLLEGYSRIRDEVRSGIDAAQNSEDRALLLSVEKQLDAITHSKQQGRDIVELMSLTAFAAVTVGLGLLIRPKGLELDMGQASWSGFLSEIFVLLFVSTITFLCINLFDVRRERETPLLVSVKEKDDDYQLFFRHKQNLKAQHFIAVSISISMSAAFCVLLYNKWMP